MMRKVLKTEIKKERCNAPALGMYNAAVAAGEIQRGEKMEGKTSDGLFQRINTLKTDVFI